MPWKEKDFRSKASTWLKERELLLVAVRMMCCGGCACLRRHADLEIFTFLSNCTFICSEEITNHLDIDNILKISHSFIFFKSPVLANPAA